MALTNNCSESWIEVQPLQCLQPSIDNWVGHPLLMGYMPYGTTAACATKRRPNGGGQSVQLARVQLITSYQGHRAKSHANALFYSPDHPPLGKSLGVFV